MMKFAFAAAFAALFFSTSALADSDPSYTKDKSAWWVSAIFVVPVVGLDVVGRAVELTGTDQGAFKPLHKSTGGIISHAATPVCGLPAVGMLCK
jgi:hypothetical protein